MEAVGGSLALRARGVTKSFLGTRALDDVDFDVARGEVHALVGGLDRGSDRIGPAS
jgi:ribose transport system ATP-binding protein